MAKSSSSPVRSQRKPERQKISAIVSKIFKLIVFHIDHISLTSADSYRCDSYCLARVFQNLLAPPKHYGVFDVFCDFQSFFQLENLGSHLAMCPDNRFLTQGKQILPKICQVLPMPFLIFQSRLPLLCLICIQWVSLNMDISPILILLSCTRWNCRALK